MSLRHFILIRALPSFLPPLLLIALLFGPAAKQAVAETKLQTSIWSEFKRHQRALGSRAKVGMLFVDLETGKTLVKHQANDALTPASTVKVVLSAAALKLLGPDYRFPTEFFASNRVGAAGKIEKLYVRGYGDPSLTNERLWLIANSLKNLGLREIGSVVLDATLFVDPPGPSGERAYQAGLSALSLNHNCYAVDITPVTLGTKPRISLTPGLGYEIENSLQTVNGSRQKIVLAQMPPVHVLKRKINRASLSEEPLPLEPEKVAVKLSGQIGEANDTLTYYRTIAEPPRYFASVLEYFLNQVGVKVSRPARYAEVSEGAREIQVYQSKPLGIIVRDLNHYSNNFIAGQLLFTLGQDSVGYFRHDVGLARVSSFLENIGFEASEFSLQDGSGLDRKNKLSPRHLVATLKEMYADFSVSPDFIASLSKFGKTGTLRKRQLGKDAESSEGLRFEGDVYEMVWGKTGTLRGVSSVSGYLQSKSGKRIAFAIIVNGARSKRAATDFEDAVVKKVIENA